MNMTLDERIKLEVEKPLSMKKLEAKMRHIYRHQGNLSKEELIRQEIERLKESGCASPIVLCDTLLAFIDSMKEESVSDDLKEEIIKRWKVLHGSGNPTPFDTFNGIACHFANCQLNKIRKEDVSAQPYDFSIGDRIRLKGNVNDTIGFCIVDIREGYYWCDADITIPHSKQHLFEKFE